MLNLPALYVEHSFTIRNTFQYGPAGIQRGDRFAKGIQRVSAEPASRTHPAPASIGTPARRSSRGRSQRSQTELSRTFASNDDRMDDSAARLVRRSAQPNDGTGRRRR